VPRVAATLLQGSWATVHDFPAGGQQKEKCMNNVMKLEEKTMEGREQ